VFGFLGDMLGGLVGGSVAPDIQGRRAERLRRQGKLECCLRVINGDVPGLATGWRSGLATLTPHELHFRPVVGGVRFLRRRPVSIHIEMLDRKQQRRPQARELLMVNPQSTVIQLGTPAATCEWAVASDQLAWAVTQLSGDQP